MTAGTAAPAWAPRSLRPTALGYDLEVGPDFDALEASRRPWPLALEAWAAGAVAGALADLTAAEGALVTFRLEEVDPELVALLLYGPGVDL